MRQSLTCRLLTLGSVAVGLSVQEHALAQAIQLDESCTATVGNQVATVGSDGVFLVQNISVFQSRDTGVAPQLYRVRATCLRDGDAITGQSEFFELTPGQTTFIADVLPSDLDPIPTSISISAPADFVPLGASVRLTVTAHFADGSAENRTLRADGTTFLSTNVGLLTVTEDGLVTGANSTSFPQTGTIAVLNEGNLGTINFTAVGPSNDFDNDGMPNDFEDLFGLNKFFNDANFDLDSDGLTNIQEFNLGTLVNNPDTDGDGIIDGLDGDPLHPEESPPTVVFISPTDGDTLVEGQTILFSVDAADDGLITSVELSTDTGFSASLTTPPFETDFTVPIGVTQILFTATATDTVANEATATATTDVIPDPLTTVIGSVVDSSGEPVDGAALTTNGGLSGASLPDGSFSIADVPTILGDIVVMASAEIAGQQLFGNSTATGSVRAGTTDVGIIVLAACSFEPDLGVNLFQSDDDTDFVAFSGGFVFPYLGTVRTGIFVNSNGNMTFDFGDRRFNPSPIPDYIINGQARISPTFVDYNPGVGGGVFVNQLADRFVVTWSHVPLFNAGGDNTVQVVLFSDGRLQFVYNGMTANGTQFGAGEILDISVATTQGGTPTLLAVDYTNQAPFSSAGPTEAVIENFNPSNLFDLDFKCVSWRPNGSGGFDVQVTPLAPCLPGGVVSGLVVDSDGNPIPDCPLTVTSSGDPNFSGGTQSSAEGRFMVTDIPIPGGINVVAFDGSSAIGSASGLLWNEGDVLDVIVAPVPSAEKESSGSSEAASPEKARGNRGAPLR